MAIATYDPKANVATLGNLILGGYAENKFISAKRKTPTFSSQVGADGKVARSKSNDRRGEVTLTLLAASTTNDALSNLAILDEQTGAGVGPFQLQDLNGTTLIHGANAWITKMPDTELAKELGEVEWMIEVDSMDVFRGGLALGGI
jgi:hypothetical protein